jgi:glycerophosphoryl diester phosphodiesterase
MPMGVGASVGGLGLWKPGRLGTRRINECRKKSSRRSPSAVRLIRSSKRNATVIDSPILSGRSWAAANAIEEIPMMTTIFLAAFVMCVSDSGEEPAIRMIAHRGGVVDSQHGENTVAALQEAIRQGYWMVEIDVRRSKDGELFLQHDANFLRTCGVNKKAGDLDWKEIAQLRSHIGGKPPCSFAEFASQCRGKMRLMIDTKETNAQTGFSEKIEEVLQANDLLKDAMFIGCKETRTYFKGKARIAIDYNGLKKAVEEGEDVASLYFLFEHGNTLEEAAVKYAQSVNVPVVPTVNDFHYLLKRGSTPETDIQRLRQLGATLFQIDSAYAEYCK